MKKNKIKEILDNHPHYRETLFCRGYLITNSKVNLSSYPFYDQWKKCPFGSLNNDFELNIFCHKWQNCYIYEKNGLKISLIGHAYNPFDMKHKEEEILKDCLMAYTQSLEAFFDKISELTGIHLIILNDNGKLIAVQDCSGRQACCYGLLKKDVYITSHPQLVADICNLDMDPFIKKLTGKWFYKYSNNHLPGNLTPYKELKNLGPNIYLEYKESFNINRFFPVKPHPELKPEEYEKTVDSIISLLNKNIQLCVQRWKKTAISLTGGVDSKTTLACANGLYDKLKCFTFHSKPSEVIDANAAYIICKELGIDHKIYPIQNNNLEVKDYSLLKQVITHNLSYSSILKENEVRKYIYFYRKEDFDVELKSNVSEIGRVSREQRGGVIFPDILTPRHFSVLQAKYVFSPFLMRKADNCYANYLKEINLDMPLYNYKHIDLHFWEIYSTFWGSTVIVGQNIFRRTVTMPFNNRKLIDMFLWFPKEYRKSDMLHKEITKRANSLISTLEINIRSPYLSNKRILLEKLYYKYTFLFYRKK
ncbi:asparagine synthase-related protein [bacterium]|nr:asparagine synthase-related protein [bacterium]